MNTRSKQDILATVISKLEQFKRKAWIPITENGDDISTASKFGGTPVLCLGENWPICETCQSPMRFFFQIDSRDLPQTEPQLFGKDGILQLFYCSSEQCDLTESPPHFPFNPRQLVRVIDRDRITLDVTPPKMLDLFHHDWPIEENYFKPRPILGWKEIDDYPNFIEREYWGYCLNEYNDDFEPDEDEEYELAHELCFHKDKLLGWPDWSNHRMIPDCPKCLRSMNKLLFQLATEDNIPYCWGDCNYGFILQCPEHLEQIAFIFDY